MRRHLIPCLTALLLTGALSCEKAPAPEEQAVRFEAASPAGTRTAFSTPEDGLYPVVWTAADRSVCISLNGTTPVEAAVHPLEEGRKARFEASFTAGDDEACTFHALSPASAFQGFSEGEWSYSVPQEQTPSEASVDPAAMVLSATSSTTAGLPAKVDLHFSHLTAYGCLSLRGASPDIRSVTLDFGEGNVLTLHTSSPEDIWFGIRPQDVSGKEVQLRVKTGAGAYTRSVTFPEGKAFEAGKIARFSVDMAGAAFEPDGKRISILAIGNSFSWDAMEYLYGDLRQAGYDDVFLGNLYIGGCSLSTHASNLQNGAKAYEYRTNSTGTWKSTDGYNALVALSSTDWDYVTVQQVSGLSGVADSYEPYLGEIVRIVQSRCPRAKLLWHQTWAYQRTANHNDFPKYGCVQIRMYNAILDALRTQVLSRGDFDGVIPCGTAIQNLRTSFIGDNVTRDGYHMSYDIGRTATALTWLKYLTGCDLGGINPASGSYTLSARQIAAVKDAVEKAVAHPLEVTESAEPPAYIWHETDPSLLQALADAGYDPAAFRELPYSLTLHAFYNSTGGSGLSTTASNSNQFAATQFFSREDIPAGSVLVLKSGYQYRPERWTRLSAKTSPRPETTTASVFAVTDAWWSGNAYRAFNLAKKGNPALTDQEQQELRSCLSIFVPKGD